MDVPKYILQFKKNMKNSFILLLVIVSNLVLAQSKAVFNTESGFPIKNINELTVDNNYYWLATDVGIYQFNKDFTNVNSGTTRATSSPVLSILNDSGFVWVGVEDKGLYKVDKSTYEFTGMFRDLIGRESITEIFKIDKTIWVAAKNNLYYKVDIANNTAQKVNAIVFHNQKNNSLKYDYYNDTLVLNGLPFLGFNKTIVTNLKEHDEEYWLQIGNDFFVFDQKYKALIPLNFKVEEQINQALILNDNLHLSTDLGLYIMDLKEVNYNYKEPKFEVVYVLFNNDTIDITESQSFQNIVNLKFLLAATNIGDNNDVFYGWSLDAENWNWQQGNSLIEIDDLSASEQPIYFKAKNIRGVETKSVKLTFNMDSAATTIAWNYILFGLGLIAYTFLVVFIVNTKKEKTIRILEDAVLEKTNELNQLKKGKYGLVEEKKINLQ